MASLSTEEVQGNPYVMKLLTQYSLLSDEAEIDDTDILQLVEFVSNSFKVPEHQLVGPHLPYNVANL